VIRKLFVVAAAAAMPLGMMALVEATAAGATSPSTSGSTVNPYSPAAGHSYRHGVVPTREQSALMRAYAATHPGLNANPTGPLIYQGGLSGAGVTSGTPKVYLVFWGKQWGTKKVVGGITRFSADTIGGAPYIQNLFKGLGTGSESWSGTMTQYCDGSSAPTGGTTCTSSANHVVYPTGGDLAGVWFSGATAPAAATQNQLATKARAAALHFHNTTTASNRYAQYVILSAPGLNPDNYKTNGFCAWHSWTSTIYGNLAYTNMPYIMDVGASCGAGSVNSPGALDGYSIIAGHEYAETLTDQFPNLGWLDNNGYENGDICAWISTGQGAAANVSTGTGSFAMQSTWSNDTNECDISHVIVP